MVDILDRLIRFRKAPERLTADNGSEFTRPLVDLLAYHHKVHIAFSRSGDADE